MNTDRIPSLIDKYFEGETTLQEEQRIKEYFANTSLIPDDLLPLKDFFLPLDDYKNLKVSTEIDTRLEERLLAEEDKARKNRIFNIRTYVTTGIAAAFVLLITFQKMVQPSFKSTVDDPVVAMQIVTEAFSQVNRNMEKGTVSLNHLGIASQATEPMEKIHYFNDTYRAFRKISKSPSLDK